MSRRTKVTTDFSDLKRRLKTATKELSKEHVAEHISDTIVDDIRNNSVNPGTGKKYKRLAKSTIQNRKYLAKHNSTHTNYSPKEPNLTITGKLLDSIKTTVKVDKEGVTYSIDVSGKHPKYKGASGLIGKYLSNEKIRSHLAKNGRDPLGLSKKMRKLIVKFLKEEINKRL